MIIEYWCGVEPQSSSNTFKWKINIINGMGKLRNSIFKSKDPQGLKLVWCKIHGQIFG